MTLSTDASTLGWGASAFGQVTGGRWSPAELGQHINILELKAVLNLSLQIIYERSAWLLEKSVFTKLLAIFEKPEIDMFASRLNHQLLSYVAWIPDPEAMAFPQMLPLRQHLRALDLIKYALPVLSSSMAS